MTAHQAALCAGLEALRLRGGDDSYVDFKIRSETGRPFPCHRVVLAAASPYFDTLFNSGFLEAERGEMALPDFSDDAVETILKYIYSGADVISDETVADLYLAGNYMQMQPLVNQCEEFLKSGIKETESLKVWQVAMTFDKLAIAEVAKTIAQKNFRIFAHVEAIGKISLAHMQLVLEDPYLNCTSKEKCRVAYVWLVAQEGLSEESANLLIEALVKSPNVDPNDIATASENCESNEAGIDELDQNLFEKNTRVWNSAVERQWIRPGNNPPSHSVRINAARLVDNESSEWLIMVGGIQTEQNKLTVLNFKEKKWYTIPTGPEDLGQRYAVCALGSNLYLSGGTTKRQFKEFSMDQKRWIRLPDLPVDRDMHCMVGLGQELFVLGGISKEEDIPRSVYKWSNYDRKWKHNGDVAYPVVSATSALVGKKVFLIGGCLIQDGKALRQPCDLVQCFETHTRYSYKIQFGLPNGIRCKAQTTTTAVVGDTIYVFHKGAVFSFNEKSILTKPENVQSCPVKGFAAVAFGDKVLLFGGENSDFLESEQVLQYDTKNHECVKLPLITPFKMNGFAYTKIQGSTFWDLTDA